MKQHILPKQVLEVSEEEFYSLFGTEGIVKRKDYANYHHKKITIGKMIEFLATEAISLELLTTQMETTDGNKSFISLNNVFYDKKFASADLCDALWQAIKYALSEKTKLANRGSESVV